MAGTGSLRTGSKGRSHRRTAVCKDGVCLTCASPYTCCCDCKNWCDVCGVRKCRAVREPKWQADATEYQREYPPKSATIDRRKAGIPPLDGPPFAGITTHRADFTPKSARVEKARAEHKPIPKNPLEGQSAYKEHYPPKWADLYQRPKQPHPDWTAPFVGLSTYNAEYVPKQVRPWTAGTARPLTSVPFEGTTEFRDKFDRKPLPPMSPRTPQPLLPSSHVGTITTYGHDYVPKPFESRDKKVCCDDPRHPAVHSHTATYGGRPATALEARPGTTQRSG